MFPVGGSRSRNSTVLCRQRRGCGAWKGSIQFCLQMSFLAMCHSLDIFSLFGIVRCETCWCCFNHFPSSIKLFSDCVHSLVYLLYYPQLANDNNKNEKLRRKRCPQCYSANDFLSPVIIPCMEGDSDVNLCFLMSNLTLHQKTWKSFARSKKDCKHFKADKESFLLEPRACCALGVVLLLGGVRVGGEASCPPCGLSPLELCPQPLS